MSTNDPIHEAHSEANDPIHETHSEAPKGPSAIVGALIAGLVLALAGNIYLLVRANHLDKDLTAMRDGTQTQISALSQATTSLLEQRLQSLNDAMSQQMKDAQTSAATALKRARSEAQKQGTEISQKLDEQQHQVSDQIGQLQALNATTDSKVTEVSSDVNNVKTDVTGVKADVASTQSNLEKTGADLKRVMGDMGVMSGLIATNSKDLDALRQLGERNYFEFDLTKSQSEKKIGNVTLSMKKSDPKHSRYTVEVLADDKRVEKRDKTINEPVQLYVSGEHQPYEIVVNQVKKDEIVGYLAIPKVKQVAQR